MFWNAMGPKAVYGTVETATRGMKLLYLFIDIGAVAVPFVFSFHPKLAFYRRWKAAWPAILLPAIPFVAWDAVFVEQGVWGFNREHISGIYLFGVPVEEVLFFICIPYACLFTYDCLARFSAMRTTRKTYAVSTALVVFLVMMVLLFPDNAYTATAFSLLAGLILTVQVLLHPHWLQNFYLAYIVLLFPFAVVNGLLTGTGLEKPVVWYNESEIIGWRIGSIPFEDVFYGMLLVLCNVLVYEWFKQKSSVGKAPGSGFSV